jgi:hypothetical protein
VLTVFIEEGKLVKAINKHFQYSGEGKIRRGIVAEIISAEISANCNPTFYKRLRKAMMSLGHREIRVNGRNYWSNLELKCSIPVFIEDRGETV